MKFYASLGNHDAREQRYYKLFNMDGKLYYTFKAPKQNVRFFALESTYLEPEQIAWLEKELERLDAKTGRFRTSTTRCIRRATGTGPTCGCAKCSSRCSSSTTSASCSPGHDHFYERIKPQKGIVVLRRRLGREAAAGRHRHELGPHRGGHSTRTSVSWSCEIDGDEMYFKPSRARARSSTRASITRRK